MICPYNVKTKTTTLQWTQTAEGGPGANDETFCEQVSTETYTMMKCPKEGCAVWREGKCQFSGEIIQDD